MTTKLLNLIVALAFGAGMATAAPLGTAFTYQGRLADGANPANGRYDFNFALYDAASGGAQQGGTVPLSAVGVTNGLFTVTLDFGNQFDGMARWLDIWVKTNGAPWYWGLTPRQELTPTPNASTATVANGVANGAVGTTGLQDGSVTATKIGGGNVVKSLNSLKDDVTLTAGANMTLTPSGQTLTLASPSDWHVGGNAGAGASFLGTTDHQPLELRVNSSRALRLGTDGSLATGNNSARGQYSTALGRSSSADGSYSTALGRGNVANNDDAVVMGYANVSGGWSSTAMGSLTKATGNYSTAMGRNTTAANDDATAMGNGTTASGWDTTAMGTFSVASGNYSLAAGYYAQATNQGSFVWADSSSTTPFTSRANNEFAVRASGGVRLASSYLLVTGGGNEQAYLGGDGNGGDVEIGSRNAGVMNVGFWNAAAFSHMNLYALTFNPGSDRNLKQGFKSVDAMEILNKVLALPVTEWAYKADAQTRHLGPVAQDFQAAFGLGSSDKSIATVDADGVALAAIQGLNEKVEVRGQQSEDRMLKLETENAELKQRLEALEKIIRSQKSN